MAVNGHFVGSQGKRGHTMVPSDHAAQGEHAYLPQGGGAGVTGQNSQGAFDPGGASGSASYQTTDVGGTCDPDSGSVGPD